MNGQIIQNICETIMHSSQQLNGVFLNEGKDLTWTLFGITIGYQLWAMVIGDNQQFLVEMLKNILIASIIFFILTNWDSFIAHFFFNNINLLAKKISPTEQDSTLNIFFDLLNSINERSFLSDIALTPEKIVAATLGNFAAVILKTATELAIILTMAAYVIVLYMGGVLLSVSLMLGPILFPWLLIKPCQFIFQGWLKFTISASLYQIVGSSMSYICRASIKHLDQLHKTLIPGYISPDQTILILIMIICFIFLTLFWQIPDICRGIISGGMNISSHHLRQHLDIRNMSKYPDSPPEERTMSLKESLRYKKR
ncbi:MULTISPECIES: type IV secretion system protein [Candidatus Ichthyocystis]|uniref:Putative TrbL/VirB6 plasmid conjugal transfer protein n=1 Tax=Candidatus Ichthyocystis hellenicum TaxID=1561003 RepID=A0A0S4M567_9BURK|nr:MULTISPECIES: type IV secretion system protein [Ichthyocystis]CUT17421.1 putative TrbL/VirB6 plasmid conjugal transfer protein [Candidatus Ichthyocystis hellenicum]